MPGRLIATLDAEELARAVGGGACIEVPPFIVRVQSANRVLQQSLAVLYGNYALLDGAVPDFVIRVGNTGGWRRFFRRQAMAFIDTPPPYLPLPEIMAPLMFEQALNWCVATRTFTHLLMHAAVVARDGKAILIPGETGQGKSTLCAALVARGWRHISDEFAMIDTRTLEVTAHPRPISLKNESIAAVQEWQPGVEVQSIMTGTPKGTVGYLPAARAAIEAAPDRVMPAAIVFPGYGRDREPAMTEVSKGRAFIVLTACCVNYWELGEEGFRAMSELIARLPVYRTAYSDTASSVAMVEGLDLGP